MSNKLFDKRSDELSVFRELISEENKMMDQRIRWLLTSQAILLAAYSISAKEKIENAGSIGSIIAVAGIFIAISGFVALRYNEKAIRSIKGHVTDEEKKYVIGYDDLTFQFHWFFLPWFGLPIFIAIFWMLLLYLK